MDIDAGRTTKGDVIQIGTIEVPINVDNTKPVIEAPVQGAPANDDEGGGSSDTSKYFLPRWCPPGLTRTQKRKLQRLRLQVM